MASVNDRALVEQYLIVYCFVYELKRFVVLWATMMTNCTEKTMVCFYASMCV